MFSTIEEKKFKDKWPWFNIFTCREPKKKKKATSQSSIVPVDDETTTRSMSFPPRLTKNLVFIIIWKHALNVTSFIFTIALAWNQKLRKKASIALLNRRISRVWFLFVQFFCSNFRLLKFEFVGVAKALSLQLRKSPNKARLNLQDQRGTTTNFYWFLTQIVNWNSHLVADLLRCQFCTQWKHVSYQMHGNSHKKWLMSRFDFVIVFNQ